MWWSYLPKIEECEPVFHPCAPVTGSGVPWGPVPVKKFSVILTFRRGDKRARCKDCNLAFMHCLLEIFIVFAIPFSMFAV